MEGENVRLIPVQTETAVTGTVTIPTPEENRISKEKEKDYSVEGILKKAKS